jgi:hypothetical protein
LHDGECPVVAHSSRESAQADLFSKAELLGRDDLHDLVGAVIDPLDARVHEGAELKQTGVPGLGALRHVELPVRDLLRDEVAPRRLRQQPGWID